MKALATAVALGGLIVQVGQPSPAPPDTDIYLAPLSGSGETLAVGTPVDITNSPGYDNQPFFIDARAPQVARYTRDREGAILFTSNRGGTQTDIYRYDIGSKQTSRVTDTPESEYSPIVTPDGGISVIRVEADGTQRLWRFTADGKDPKVLLPDVRPVGYHAWSDTHTLALFVLGQPATLQVADTATGTPRIVASDIGRSLVQIPGGRTVSFVQREHDGARSTLSIRELDPPTGRITTLTSAVEGAAEADCAWTPDGLLLMAHAGKLYSWRRGSAGWRVVADLERLRSVTRLAVSGDGRWLAIVAAPPRGA